MGLIFGGAYVRREICISKSIGLAYSWKEIYRFCFVLLCILGQFPSTSFLGGGLILGGAISRMAFCVMSLGGLYKEGLTFGILQYTLKKFFFGVSIGDLIHL